MADAVLANPASGQSALEGEVATVPPQGRYYHAELDIVRFFAFLVVYAHHSMGVVGESAGGWVRSMILAGGLGVDLFFGLSAFLITELLVREHQRWGRIDVKKFLIRRSLRIWPLYFVFVALAAFVVPLAVPAQSLSSPYTVPFFTFTANWATAMWGYPNSVAAPLWSVSIEEQFYIAFPLLLVGLGIRRLPWIAGGMLLTAFAARLWLVGQDVAHPGIWTNTFARLDPFAAGMLLALSIRRQPTWTLPVWMRTMLIGGGAFLCVAATHYLALSGSEALGLYPLVAVGAASILAGTYTTAPLRDTRLVRSLAYLGKISYGLYVFHLVGFKMAGYAVSVSSPSVEAIIGLVLTVVLAALSFKFLEEPFLRLKSRFTMVKSRD